jgi:parallel beta-helix repeat protein
MQKFCKIGTPLFFLITLLAFALSIGSVSAANLDVGPSGHNYTSINQALNNSHSGDTIDVYDDNGTSYTYKENVVINKTNISLVSKGKVTLTQNDINSSCIIVTGFGNGSQIKGFNIISKPWIDDGNGPLGVSLSESSNCLLYNNTIKGFMWGITSGNGNVIDNNIIYDNGYGIEIYGSNITNNRIYKCGMGISDHGSEQKNIISKNTIYDCREGIYMVWCDFSLIEGNIINNCSAGWGDYSGNITFTNNTVSNCKIGIAMNANHNIILRNNIQNNQVGIDLTAGNDNQISRNNIKFNSKNGIQLYGSSRNNITQNNITNNSVGILIDEYHDTTYLLLSNDNHIFGNDISQNGNGITFGSIFSKPSGNKVNFNRIVANTNWGLVNYSSELVNAKWNWWGSNSDPKNKIYGPLVNGTISNVFYAPWIVLTGSSSSSIILGTYEIVAYLNKGSNGISLIGGNVPNGIKVLFSTTKGTIASPKYTNLGSASSKLVTKLSLWTGIVLVSIKVDNQTISIPVTNKAVKISEIIYTANYVKKYSIKYHKLPTKVTITKKQVNINQFIKLMGTAILEINGYAKPVKTYRHKISRKEYLIMVKKINSFIDTKGRAPSYIKTSLGTISLNKVINMYYSILSYYQTKHRLPNYVKKP